MDIVASYKPGQTSTTMAGQSRILIVDDNNVIREVLRGLIRHDPRLAVVGEAGNGETAIELVAQLKPHLVCLDVLMPGMDGLEALKSIREAHPEVRVILITGQATSDVVSEALKLGANGFVVKPFSADKVLKAIHTALGNAT